MERDPEHAFPRIETWSFSRFDTHQWGAPCDFTVLELLSKLKQLEGLSWQELRQKGGHQVERAALSPEASKRLEQLKTEDVDELFSLRLDGRRRLFGFREGNHISVLWWDPHHLVCPARKKGT